MGAAKSVHTRWLLTGQWDTGENRCDTQSNKRRKKTMRFPRNSVSQCSRCTGGLLGSKQASLLLYLLPAPTLQSAGATTEHTSRKPQIETREHFHVARGAVLTKLCLTVNVLRCQSVPSLPFADLWVDPQQPSGKGQCTPATT